MAFPVIESQSPATNNATGGAAVNGSSAATSHTVNLPATVSAGSLLLIVGRVAVAGSVAVTGGGWSIGQDSSDASDDVSFWGYKSALAVGDEGGTSITITHGSGKMVARVFSITGAGNPGTFPPDVSTVAVGTGSNPGPTSETPSGGAKDYLWIAVGMADGEHTSPPATIPANYGDSRGDTTGTAGAVGTNASVFTATRNLNAASEDPGTWTTNIAVNSGWTSWTIAIHPAPPTQPNLTLTGSAVASGTLALQAPTQVPLAASSSVASGSLDLTAAAPAIVPLAGGSAVASGSLGLTAPAILPLASSAAVANGTLVLRAPALLPLEVSNAVGAAALSLRAPAQVPLAAGTASGTASLALRAPSLVGIDGDAAGSGSLSLATVPRLALSGSAQGSGSLAFFSDFGDLWPEEDLYPGENLYPGEAPPDEGPAYLGLEAGSAQASASLTITTPAQLDLSGSAGASASMSLRVPEMLVLTGSAQASGSLALGYRPRLVLTGSAVASGTLGLQALSVYAQHKRLNVYVAETNLALQSIITETQINLLMTVTEPAPLNVEADENASHIVYVDERPTPIQIVEVTGIQVSIDETPDGIMNVEVDD